MYKTDYTVTLQPYIFSTTLDDSIIIPSALMHTNSCLNLSMTAYLLSARHDVHSGRRCASARIKLMRDVDHVMFPFGPQR